jgi:hypothetical protein
VIDSQQREHLDRVSTKLGPLILSWCRDRFAHAPEFSMVELASFVSRHVPSAPASTDRIVRELRRQGLISYEVTNRRASLYRLLAVQGEQV